MHKFETVIAVLLHNYHHKYAHIEYFLRFRLVIKIPTYVHITDVYERVGAFFHCVLFCSVLLLCCYVKHRLVRDSVSIYLFVTYMFNIHAANRFSSVTFEICIVEMKEKNIYTRAHDLQVSYCRPMSRQS